MNNSLALFQLLTAQDGVGENGADATVGVLRQRPEGKREEYQQHRHQPRTTHEHVREEERKERDALHPSRHHRRHRLYPPSSDKQRKVTFWVEGQCGCSIIGRGFTMRLLAAWRLFSAPQTLQKALYYIRLNSTRWKTPTREFDAKMCVFCC